MIELSNFTVDELREIAKRATAVATEKQKDEVADTVKKLLALSDSTGIPLKQLIAPYKRRAYPPSRIKYRNPDNPDQAWSGRGQKPAWYRAKIEAGISPNAMQISE